MLVTDVQACIDAYAMFPIGARVIVAVSGGPDSMALLSTLYHLRSRYALTLMVAHVNHLLRAEEAHRDAIFVQQQAARFALPFYQTQVQTKTHQRATGLSPQHAARQLRYAFFETLRSSVNASHVALGHTADDQAETLLMRFIRGGGPASLGGIPAVRPPFVRPLITTSRSSILAYLDQAGMAWVSDSSNTQRTYLRNRLRLELLPMLQRYNPQVVTRLNELAEMLQAESRVLDHYTDSMCTQLIRWRTDGRVVIQCTPYATAPLAIQRRVVRRVIDTLLITGDTTSFRQVEGLRRFIIDGPIRKRHILPGGIMAERQRETVWLWNTWKPLTITCPLPLHVPGETTMAGLGLRFIADVMQADGAFERFDARQACLDIECTQPVLTVRLPQPGDRFYPLGAPGHKKLKDFFIDNKIPRAERSSIPLLMSGSEIAWVVGYRIADPFKVRPKTRRILRLRCEPTEGYSP